MPPRAGGAPRRAAGVRVHDGAAGAAGAPRWRDDGARRRVDRERHGRATSAPPPTMARRGRRVARGGVHRGGVGAVQLERARDEAIEAASDRHLPATRGGRLKVGSLEAATTKPVEASCRVRIEPRRVVRRGVRPNPRTHPPGVPPRVPVGRDHLGSGADRVRRRRGRGGLVGHRSEHRHHDGPDDSAPDGSRFATAAIHEA